MRALWIEIREGGAAGMKMASRPVRALWIEMIRHKARKKKFFVEAREGLVD